MLHLQPFSLFLSLALARSLSLALSLARSHSISLSLSLSLSHIIRGMRPRGAPIIHAHTHTYAHMHTHIHTDIHNYCAKHRGGLLDHTIMCAMWRPLNIHIPTQSKQTQHKYTFSTSYIYITYHHVRDSKTIQGDSNTCLQGRVSDTYNIYVHTYNNIQQ